MKKHRIKKRRQQKKPASSILYAGQTRSLSPGYHVDVVATTEEAIKQLMTTNYDMLVCDISLQEKAAGKERVIIIPHHGSARPNPSSSLSTEPSSFSPPQRGERILLLILSREERVNIPGDLAEEFSEIAAKHGERYARLWYYKQVVSSAWPIICKTVKWGLLASIGAWIRRLI